MTQKKNPAVIIEQEISKQIDEFDKKVDRGGFVYLLLIVLVLFLLVFWLVESFSISDRDNMIADDNEAGLYQRIEELEQSVTDLEARIIKLESQSQ